jgi:hypothetical protein
MEMLSIEGVSYLDIIKLSPDFVSLDISVHSTGYARWYKGELTTGTYSIQAPPEDEVGRRREFRTFLKDLLKDDEFEYLFIEDVIGSINFKTAKALYQLNPIADDMIDSGVLNVKTVIREGNKVWKSYLRKCSGYVSPIRSKKDDKEIIRDCLLLMGFGDGTNKTIKEDIYDAIGLACGIIYKRYILKDTKSGPKLKKDLSKGYKILQFPDLYQALDEANDIGGEIHQVNFMNIKKDLKYNFKNMIETLDDDKKTFVISILTCKMGAIALDKNLDLSREDSYLVVFRTKK